MTAEVKKELTLHLTVLLFIFLFIEVAWILSGKLVFSSALLLLSGLLAGSFILDLDHLVYWLFLYPELSESKKARELLRKKDIGGILLLLSQTHKSHTSLVFHHFIFQAILFVLILFVFTSTGSIFGKGFILSVGAHLLADQWQDWKADPKHLQKWLFARTPFATAPLPSSWIKNYLFFYSAALLILTYASFR